MSSLPTEAVSSRFRIDVWSVAARNAHPFREYLPVMATEFTVLVSQILVYKLAARYLGQAGFSEYAVARRMVSLISPLTLLGLGVGLPRYLAHCNGCGNPGAVARYCAAAAGIVGGATLFAVALLNLVPGHFGFLLFGRTSYAELIFPLSLMVLGLSLHTTAYSYFRGQLLMRRANLLQLANQAVVPVASFFLLADSARGVMLTVGLFWSAVGGAALLSTPLRRASLAGGSETRELLRYGIQRVPGDFILMALLAVPISLVAHRSGVEAAGFLAFGISALTMIGAGFSPVGLMLLPRASAWLAGGRLEQLRAHVIRLVAACALAAAAATVAVWWLAGPLIGMYLGHGFEPAAAALRVIVLGAVPYSLFVVLRNLIDAFHRNAVTGLISAMAFAVFAVAAWLGGSWIPAEWGVVVALLLGLLTLGGASCWECMRILRATSGGHADRGHEGRELFRRHADVRSGPAVNSDASLVLSIVFFLAMAAATAGYAVLAKGARLADPILQFVFFFSLFVLPLPVRVSMTKAIEGDVTEHLLGLLPYLPEAVFLSALGLAFFTLAYYSRLASRIASRLPQVGQLRGWRRSFAVVAAVSLLLLTLLAHSAGGLLSFFLLGYDSTAEMVGKGYLAVGFPWLFVAAMFLLCGYAVEKKPAHLLCFALVAALLVATQLVMGRRGFLVYMALASGIFWHHAIRPIRVRSMLAAGLVSFAGLNLLGRLRSSAYEDFHDFWARGAEAWESNSDSGETFVYTLTTGEFVVPFESLPQVIESLGGAVNPEFGMTYVRAPLQAIPQALFPGRPLPLANWYVRKFYGGGYEFNEGRQFFFLSEGYLNFGIAGVLLTMLCWGLLLGAAHRYRLRAQGNAGALLLYSLTIAFIYMGIAGDSTSVLVGLPELSLFPAALGLCLATGNSRTVLG